MRRQFHPLLCLTALLATSLAWLPPTLGEARADEPTLAGAWVNEPKDSDDMDAAISRAADKVNFIIRGIVHGRLRDTNRPYRRVEIGLKGDTLSVSSDTRGVVTAPVSGVPVKWTRSDGQVYDVVMGWKLGGRRLEESFSNAEGKRVNVYELRPGGQAMDMRVTVSSPKLPVPLTYRLGYRRVP